MTTIDVQTAISPAVLYRLYELQAHQDMYGGGNPIAVTTRQGVRSMSGSAMGGAVMDPAAASGTVSFPIVLDQSAAANPVPNLDWYPRQYVASNDDAKTARREAEYAIFREQFNRASLSLYK
jgi:hypothetical protein